MFSQTANPEILYRGKYRLRRMQAQDVEQVWQLEKSVFPSPWSMESFYLELKNQHISRAYVVTCDQDIAAYTIVWEIGDELHIANIAVSKDHRRKGLATFILKFIIGMAAAKKIKTVYLEVRKSNRAAILLYKKFAFQVTGIRKNYYQAENEDALLMSCHLEKINQNTILE